MPRYLVIRDFQVGAWEHRHVVVDADERVFRCCVYRRLDERHSRSTA